jgi:uncharacterized membrane protein YeaQ/YmgE (transglycosylase-associated protein family)
MIELLNMDVLSWIILHLLCGLIGGTILGDSNKTKVGVLLGVLLGLLGLIFVVMICQREHEKHV